MSNQLPLHVDDENGIVTIHFRDPILVNRDLIDDIHDQLTHSIAADANKVLISFEHVASIGTAVIGMILGLKKLVAEHDGQLRLADMNEDIRSVFTISGLDQTLEIDETSDEAIASFE